MDDGELLFLGLRVSVEISKHSYCELLSISVTKRTDFLFNV